MVLFVSLFSLASELIHFNRTPKKLGLEVRLPVRCQLTEGALLR